MSSKLETNLNDKILELFTGRTSDIAYDLLKNEEIKHLLDYANHVSIVRLNFNDHGPVHARKVVINSILLFNILLSSGIQPTIVKENLGDEEDGKTVLLISSFLHDTGMSMGRENHEISSILVSKEIIRNLLARFYPGNLKKQVVLRSMILECIKGHMANYDISTIEAGIILAADGLDMEEGRARIPMKIDVNANPGDIHQFSSSKIKSVEIVEGIEKPIRIKINMSETVGFFQVEELLMKKISASTIKNHIELFAGVINTEYRRYL